MTKKTLVRSVLLVLSLITVLGADSFDVRDENEFWKVVERDARVEKLAGDFRFTEGPVWIKADGGFLVFSDIPADELKKWSENGGATTYRKPSQKINGNTTDLKGRLVSAEHWGRRISRTEKDGSIVTVVDNFEGRKLNSPNDVVVRSDGTIWFTDPDYGLEGRSREMEGNWVFFYDPATKKLKPIAKDFDKPNGLCFSPDEKRLYVADSGRPRHIRVFEVRGETVENGRVFGEIDRGGPDGIRCDAQGRVFSSAGDGVHIFNPDGKLIGKILCPEAPANLCFGGAENKTLFITARTGLYRIGTKVAGGGVRK